MNDAFSLVYFFLKKNPDTAAKRLIAASGNLSFLGSRESGQDHSSLYNVANDYLVLIINST